MSLYARDTNVSVAKSRAEIEECITRYGATKFAHLMEHGRAVIMFEAKDRRIMFDLPLPDREAFKTKDASYHRAGRRIEKRVDVGPEEQGRAWEQACRQKWRALALVIKAKLEAVDSGITTFDDEFLAHVVLPNGKRLGSWIAPQLEQALRTDKMPPMLPSGDHS